MARDGLLDPYHFQTGHREVVETQNLPALGNQTYTLSQGVPEMMLSSFVVYQNPGAGADVSPELSFLDPSGNILANIGLPVNTPGLATGFVTFAQDVGEGYVNTGNLTGFKGVLPIPRLVLDQGGAFRLSMGSLNLLAWTIYLERYKDTGRPDADSTLRVWLQPSGSQG